MWYNCQLGSRPPKATNNSTSIAHHTVFNDGQNLFHKTCCKSHKINEVTLFIKDNLIYRQNVKQITRSIKNNNHCTTGTKSK